MNLLAIELVGAFAAAASVGADEMWLEIAHGMGDNEVKLRVMDPHFRSDLYWVDRSDDGGRTWEPHIQVQNGDWTYVGNIPQASMFRARLEMP